MTARSVVFEKEKPSNNLKHKTSWHFKFTLRSKKEVYFSFSPLWSEQYQMSLCETSLNADRKKCIFNDRDDFATVIIRFFNTFLRMSLVLKIYNVKNRTNQIQTKAKHISRLTDGFLLRLITPLGF